MALRKCTNLTTTIHNLVRFNIRLSKPKKLLALVVLINLILTLIAETSFRLSIRPWLGKNFFTYLLAPIGQFDDFFGGLPNPDTAGVTSFNGYVLPPVYSIVYEIFSILPTEIIDLRFFAFQSISILIFLSAVRVCTEVGGWGVLTLLTYPVIFCFFRGNNELITVGIFFLSVKALDQGRTGLGSTLAASNQLFELSPLLFLLARPWKRAHIFITFRTVVVSFLLFLIVHPTLNLFDWALDFYNYIFNHSSPERVWVLYNNSIWNLLSYFDVLLSRNGQPTIFQNNVSIIEMVFLISAVICIVLVLKRGNRIDQILIGVSMWLLVPVFSFDYKLTYLVIPFLMICEDISRSRRKLQCIMIVLLLSPKHVLSLPADIAWPVGGTENGILNPLLLSALIIVTMKDKQSV